MITIALICIALALLLNYFIKLQWKLTYWKRLGVPQMTHNVLDIGEQYNKVYKYLRKKGLRYGGSYFFTEPQFVPVDLDLIKDIVQTNFSHFVNHSSYYDKSDPIQAHLFNLENEKWRNMRVKLTPTFTSGKMKMMFQTVVDTTAGLVKVCKEHANNHKALEMKDISARYAMDVIGSVAFGVECNCIENPEAEFRKYGNKVTENITYKMYLGFLCPSFLRSLFKTQSSPTEKTPSQFFKQVVEDLIQYRETNNVHRNDFFQLLLQIKNNKGTVDETLSDQPREIGNGLTANEIAAQCFIFFLGGFETTSSTMTFALYELSLRQDIQEKLRKEMKEVLKKNGGQLTYDAIMKMEYLDKVANETLRLHPPVRFLPRSCTKDYQIPGSNFIVKKGTSTTIPIEGIHKDPEFYPDPEKFDPERFSPENKATRHPMAFIPFGEGPRMCIGSRFAYLQSKIGLISILSKFKVSINSKTTNPIVLQPTFTINNIKGGLWLDFENVE